MKWKIIFSATIGLASKGANIKRHVCTITRDKYLRSHLFGTAWQSLSEVQTRVLAPHIIFKSISTTHARAQCMRKIHTHLLARSSVSTTDLSTKTEIRHISKVFKIKLNNIKNQLTNDIFILLRLYLFSIIFRANLQKTSFRTSPGN